VYIYDNISVTSSEMFQTKVVVKMKAHILCSVTSVPNDVPFFEMSVEEYGRAGQATDDSTAPAQCVLERLETPRICNTFCFCTATVVRRTRVSITLYVQNSC
jgi:hypothetical protein